ncbi:MAG: peptidoglycan editing factor PgeF [Caldithrix sp.]|nr:peptidoglycan editing factor PgeF [Caldithrix sp.]
MDVQTKTFAILSRYPGLIHGFSTRRNGYSRDWYESLNLGMHTQDDPGLVRKNRNLFYKSLHIIEDQIVYPQQVHGDHVAYCTKPGTVPHCDALITDRKSLFLSIQTADCFPVFLFDPATESVGLIHSGWRGTSEDIVGKTILKMQNTFNAIPSNLIAAIGPGVQQRCYQVDSKTAHHFEARFYKDDGPGHYLLDIQSVLVEQLVSRGVHRSKIELDDTCTHCADHLYYSYRRDGLNAGRMMGIIGMR